MSDIVRYTVTESTLGQVPVPIPRMGMIPLDLGYVVIRTNRLTALETVGDAAAKWRECDMALRTNPDIIQRHNNLIEACRQLRMAIEALKNTEVT